MNEWQNILAFDDFRVSKALPDAFGETTESILTMVSEGFDTSYGGYEPGNASLWALNSALSRQLVWESGSPSAGQSFGVQVGNEWYFGNGVDNKKWLQTLFTRTAAVNTALVPLNTYPFMTTYTIDPNGNIQQMIGAIVQSADQTVASPSVSNIYITAVNVLNNVLTLTVNSAPYNTGVDTGAVPAPPIGTSFFIWSTDNGPAGQFGVDTATAYVGPLAFLQGMQIVLTEVWNGTTITANIVAPNLTTTNVTAPNTAFIQILNGGSVPSISPSQYVLLGPSVPIWGTAAPSTINDFGGSITQDGQVLWVNRGSTVENWGIEAPDEALVVSTFGASAGSWSPSTYYSPASIVQDTAGYLWQIFKAGTTGVGFSASSFTASPTPAPKFDIYSVQLNGIVGGLPSVTFGVENLTTPRVLAAGDTFVVNRLRVTTPSNITVCNGLIFTVAPDGVSDHGSYNSATGSQWTVTATANSSVGLAASSGGYVADAGYGLITKSAATVNPAVNVANGSFFQSGTEIWLCIQPPVTAGGVPGCGPVGGSGWIANQHFYEDDFMLMNGQWQQCVKGIQPFIHSLSPGNSLNQTPIGSSFSTGGVTPPETPVTFYGFNSSTMDQGTFKGYYPLENNVAPNLTPSSQPTSLWMQVGTGATQAALPFSGAWPDVGSSGSGDIQFYQMGGGGYLSQPGAPVDSGIVSQGQGGAVVANIYIPNSNPSYNFTIMHVDGAFFGFVGASAAGSWTPPPNQAGPPGYRPSTAYNISFNNLVGQNTSENSAGGSSLASHVMTNTGTFTFPSAGVSILESDWVNWLGGGLMTISVNGSYVAGTTVIGQNLAGGSISPFLWKDLTWNSLPSGGFTQYQITGAAYNAPATYPVEITVAPYSYGITFGGKTIETNMFYTWMNLGPVANFVALPSTPYTLAGTGIVVNASEFLPYGTGVSASTIPTAIFTAASTPGTVTAPDGSGGLRWINIGTSTTPAGTPGKITATSATGFIYGIALVNTLDNTVSNLSPTNAVNGLGIQVVNGEIVFAPGEGLDINNIDPQADYVAIYRTTDGGSIELLVPSGGNTNYTVPLVQYLVYGYVDSTPDTGLDILVQGAVAQQNTPPAPGAVNLAYYLNRIWYSIGNTTYYTSGPLDPSGNGINGAAPGNTETNLSRVTRLVPSSIGVLEFTLSDVNIVPTQSGAILTGQPYVPGLGLSSYNALDINGTQIGMFTTDHQFVIFTPQHGVDHEGHPIANLLRLDIDEPGMSWNPAQSYVAWYVNGEDMGWFLADGTNGWYRLIQLPAPEQEAGGSWSPFATINPVTTYGYMGQGCGAIKAVEVEPGVHNLLIGPALTGGTDGFGSILYRNLDASSDGGSGTYNGGPLVNGTTYPAFGVFGSYVCAQPGQVAAIYFITTDQVNVGCPATLGVIFNEALPYYTGSFDILKNWVTDPPNLPESSSILGQRFYMSEAGDGDTAALCRHMQVMIQWPAESALNELQSFTIFGSFGQEA